MKKLIQTIWNSGPATIVLYTGLFVCLILLIVNIFHPISSNLTNLLVNIFSLTILANILCLKIRDDSDFYSKNKLKKAGVLEIFPRMGGDTYNQLMSRPGKKTILNTWIYNFADLNPLLNESIQYAETTVDFFY